MAELKLCECCGKETAAVFVMKKAGDSERRQALCLHCAEKRKIPSVGEYVKRLKKTDTAVRMCGQCGEQPATVFVSASKNGGAPEIQALCAFCAREKNNQPVTELLTDMDISDSELRDIHADILNRTPEQKPEGFWQRLRRRIKKPGIAE